jgi:VanZ family protein
MLVKMPPARRVGRFNSSSRKAKPATRKVIVQAMSHRIRSLISYWLPPLGWMVLICPFTSDVWSLSGNSRFLIPLLRWLLPDAPDDHIRFLYIVIRKVGHFIAYFILSWLLFRAVRSDSDQQWRGRWAVTAALLAIGYAVFDEVAQSFLATRTASIMDVLIDSAAAITAMMVVALYVRIPKAASLVSQQPQ